MGDAGDAAARRPARARARPPEPRRRRWRASQPGTRCAVNLSGRRARGARARARAHRARCARADDRDDRRARRSGSPRRRRVGASPTPVDAARGHRRAARADRADRRPTALAPGASGFARLHLVAAPIALLPGDRFVLRGFARTAIGATLGGGTVLDVAPPHRRRSDPELVARARRARAPRRARPTCACASRARASRAPTRAALARETGRAAGELDAAIEQRAARRRARDARASACSTRRRSRGSSASCSPRSTTITPREPLRPGMSARRAARRAARERAARGRASSRSRGSRARGAVARSRPIACASPSTAPTLDPRRAAGAATAIARAARARPGSSRPRCATWPRSSGRRARRARDLLAHLERERRARARAPASSGSTRARSTRCARACRAPSRAHDELDTPGLQGADRHLAPYAVPLMELFDAEHLTVRRGETRVLRRSRP